MKKQHLYFLILLLAFGCKKENAQITDQNPANTAPAPTMHIIITSSQIFSYNITESDPISNQFTTKDDYDVASLDYSFTPEPGNVVTIEAASDKTGTMAPVVTYKGKTVGPITTHGNGSDPGTGFEFTYTVPAN
ncbi:hypothetical protein [Mucilaginibacter sp. dw_454]|uniref:hypothetical protein n=1 Tax=Mucilaginibacter sp. dw_454 TaxID=2720079 RepID=UPI001BD4DF02|nr:hypothetical protein [Mucilaginibacter sp. dw_454]